MNIQEAGVEFPLNVVTTESICDGRMDIEIALVASTGDLVTLNTHRTL